MIVVLGLVSAFGRKPCPAQSQSMEQLSSELHIVTLDNRSEIEQAEGKEEVVHVLSTEY